MSVPASIRAQNPAQGLASASALAGDSGGQLIAPVQTITAADYRFGTDADQSDTSTREGSDSPPAPDLTRVADPVAQKPGRPFATQPRSSTTALRPRRELIETLIPSSSHSPGAGDSPSRQNDGTQTLAPPIEQLATHVTSPGDSGSQPSPEIAMRLLVPARPEPSGRDISEPAHPQLLSRHGSNEVVPSAGPARSVAANEGVRAPNESRSIQVKIGRVEIRSSQPALAVARTPRPSGTSGFEDLRMARIYLDRSAR